MKVRISECRRGETSHRTEFLDEWLREVIKQPGIENKVEAITHNLIGLMCKLVDKGILSVEDVISATGEFNVMDAAKPVPEDD